MSNNHFVDGLVELSFLGGVVRMRVGAHAAATPGSTTDKPPLEEYACMVMTPEGFLSMYNGMQNMMNHFIEKGIVRQNNNLLEMDQNDSGASGREN